MAAVCDIANGHEPRILDLLQPIKWRGNQGTRKCPAHDDRNPSLSVTRNDDGSVAIHCHTGCSNDAILEAIGGTRADFYPPKNGNGKHSGSKRGPEDHVYVYERLDGQSHEKVRYRNPKSFLSRRPDGRGDYIWNLEGVPPTLYRLPELKDAIERGDLVVFTEGEKDADNAARLGFVTTTNIEGAAKPDQKPKWCDEYTEQLRGADVVLIPDNDGPGRAHLEHAAGELLGVARRVRILTLPGVPHKGDLTDWINAGGTRDQLQELIDAAPEWIATNKPTSDASAHAAINAVTMDAVERKPIEWIYYGRIARGKITCLDGDPGTSKSTITTDWSARISRGMQFPNEALRCEVGNVAILSYEDSLHDTILPRLEAAGADLSRITAITGIPCEDGSDRPVVIPDDLPLISPYLDDKDMLVIDPLSAALSGKIDGNKDTDVRRALHALKNLAEARNLAILIVRHLNKSGGGNALYRGAGSIGIIGAARIGLLVADDPDNSERRILAVSKCNLARHAPSLAYRVSEHPHLQAPMIDWDGTVDKTANDLLAQNKPSPAIAEASAFLMAELAGGPRLASELYDVAEGKGIAIPTLKRARKQLGIETTKEHKNAGKWLWFLKGDQPTPTIDLDLVDPLDPLQKKEGDQGDQGDQDHLGVNVIPFGVPQP